MAEKDMTEKKLLEHNDVFADAANLYFFSGEQRIKPESLRDIPTHDIWRERGVIREQERDIAKLWLDGGIVISMIGIENQTTVDSDMPFRVIGYDGGSYRAQLDDGKTRYPVVTIVFYFGFAEWTAPLRLSGCLDVPEFLRPFFNDYRVNLFDVSSMTDEQMNVLTSDFRIMADFFAQKKRTGIYVGTPQEIRHMDSVLKLMSAVTGDRRFEEAQNEFLSKKEGNSMIDVLSRIEDRGISIGRAEGMSRGIISTARALGASDSIITGQLVEQMKCTITEAQQMLKNFA